MNVEDALDRLTTIDQLPEVGPDLVEEVEELLDIVEDEGSYDEAVYARDIYKSTMKRAVAWNP